MKLECISRLFFMLGTHHLQPRRLGPILGFPSLRVALIFSALCAIASVAGHVASGSGPFSIVLYLYMDLVYASHVFPLQGLLTSNWLAAT